MAHTFNAAEVSGRATGVLFFAGFGSIWLYNGLTAMHCVNLISDAAIAAILLALCVPALRLLRTVAKGSSTIASTAKARETKRVFLHVNLTQWLAILVSIALLNLVHKTEFITPVITFIVGMHLFPLATVFHYPQHKVTGWLLVIWATVVVTLLPGVAIPAVCGVGTAVILLGSAAYTLIFASRAAKSVRPIRTGSRLAA